MLLLLLLLLFEDLGLLRLAQVYYVGPDVRQLVALETHARAVFAQMLRLLLAQVILAHIGAASSSPIPPIPIPVVALIHAASTVLRLIARRRLGH